MIQGEPISRNPYALESVAVLMESRRSLVLRSAEGVSRRTFQEAAQLGAYWIALRHGGCAAGSGRGEAKHADPIARRFSACPPSLAVLDCALSFPGRSCSRTAEGSLFAGDAVHVWRAEYGIAHATEFVPTQSFAEKENHIRFTAARSGISDDVSQRTLPQRQPAQCSGAHFKK